MVKILVRRPIEKSMRVLLAEDEPHLCEQIKKLLNAEGRVVDIANNGIDAQHLGANEPYDMIILDLGLPERDGISVLRDWRSAGVKTPVLILTARDGWSERVDGLDAGADDYMTKPFHLPELAARVRAILRRQSGQLNPVIEMGNVILDTRNGRVTVDGVPIDLTAQGDSGSYLPGPQRRSPDPQNRTFGTYLRI